MPDGSTTPLVSLDHEELVIRRGRRSGAYTVVAVHSTARGPALGGCRMWRYASSADGARDALRLSRAMTLKAAVAGVPLGGGKGVICADPGRPPAGRRRRDMLFDFADTVNALEGRYVTAEDVGTSAADMALIAQRTSHVVGLPVKDGGSGDPSPHTARGVLAAIRACLAHRTGYARLEGRRVCLVGAGHVGTRLARLLAGSGAELTICDVDPSRRGLAKELGAAWLEPEAAIEAECEVLCPCALGGTIDDTNVDRLHCAIVCGSANNILADEDLAEALAARDILYAPDFIANAGGLISVYGELHRLPEPQLRRLVAGIGETVARILVSAEEASITPLAAARELAEARLAGARTIAA